MVYTFIQRTRKYTEFQVLVHPLRNDAPYVRSFIVGDSRCWGLWDLNWDTLSLNELTLVASRGARIEDFSDTICDIMAPAATRYFSVKLALGVNNVLRGESPHRVISRLLQLKSKILAVYPDALVAFADVAMVNLEKYQQVTGRRQRFSSELINGRIQELNELIYIENNRLSGTYLRGGATPFLGQSVCRSRRRRTRQGVVRIMRAQQSYLVDGLHVSDACRSDWVRTFLAAFRLDYDTFLEHFNRA